MIFVCSRSLKDLQIKRMTRRFKVSVCGKALICGGYLILDDNHEGISLGLSSRCLSLVEMDETDEQSTIIDIYSDLLNTTWNYVLFKKNSGFYYEYSKYMIICQPLENSMFFHIFTFFCNMYLLQILSTAFVYFNFHNSIFFYLSIKTIASTSIKTSLGSLATSTHDLAGQS